MGLTWVSHGIHMEIHMKMFQKHTFPMCKAHVFHVQCTRFTCDFHMISHVKFHMYMQNHMYMWPHVTTCAFAHVKFMWFFCKGRESIYIYIYIYIYRVYIYIKFI